MLKFFRIFVAKFSLMAEEMDIQHTEAETPKRMVLRAEGLVKKYGKRTVVNGVNFEVKQGEIVGLLGPNGAGKTTIIQAIQLALLGYIPGTDKNKTAIFSSFLFVK